MALSRGFESYRIIGLILFVRISSVFLVKTWYVPDEYWQSLEVAHNKVFGYGALTWEWQKGIRSYLYPGVFAVIYSVLKLTGLDNPVALIYLPRILQALLSTVADYSFYKWTGGRKWALFLVLTSWFWFYTSSRTLLQTVETSLVTIALSVFPFKENYRYGQAESNKWCWLACICVFLRPTSAPLWVVLGIYNLLTTEQGRMKLIFKGYLPALATTSAVLIGLDSYFYGHIIITIWEFFKFNVVYNVASFYGSHPWYWYLSQGLPAVVGVFLAPLLIGITMVLRRPREYKIELVLLIAALAHIAVHSFIPHKEFRFILPLLPIFLYLAQDVLVRWSRKAKRWQMYVVAFLIFVCNLTPALYFGLIHQRGTMEVMPLLRENIHNNKTSVFFMMPCHSTPFYSHLHINATARYLNCDPPLDKIGEGTEAERFFLNPARWWRAEFANRPTPDYVVMFDKMRSRADPVLAAYNVKYMLDHTQFPEGEVSEKVLILQKSEPPKPTPASPPPAVDEVL